MMDALLWFAFWWLAIGVSVASVSWFGLIPGKWTVSEVAVFVGAYLIGWPLLLLATVLMKLAEWREDRMRDEEDET